MLLPLRFGRLAFLPRSTQGISIRSSCDLQYVVVHCEWPRHHPDVYPDRSSALSDDRRRGRRQVGRAVFQAGDCLDGWKPMR